MIFMHVLNVTEVSGLWWLWVVFGFLCALSITAVIAYIISDTKEPTCYLSAALLIIAVIVFGVNVSGFKRNQYQVIIDKETTFYEIYEKYNVIKQDGFIFTLEERGYLEDDD